MSHNAVKEELGLDSQRNFRTLCRAMSLGRWEISASFSSGSDMHTWRAITVISYIMFMFQRVPSIQHTRPKHACNRVFTGSDRLLLLLHLRTCGLAVTGGLATHRRAKRHKRGGCGHRSIQLLQFRRMGHPWGAGRPVSRSWYWISGNYYARRVRHATTLCVAPAIVVLTIHNSRAAAASIDTIERMPKSVEVCLLVH